MAPAVLRCAFRCRWPAERDIWQKVAATVSEDRRQDRDIERVLGLLREGSLPLGPYA